MERLKGELEPQHHAAINMKIEGKPPADIAVALGVKERTVHLWFSDDKIKETLNERVAQINDLFAQRMAEVGMVGIHELLALARMPVNGETIGPEMKLEIAKEILDRVPQTARVADRGKGGGGGGGGTSVFTSGPVAVANMTDEQLLERARELGVKVPALEEGLSGAAGPADPD